MRTLLFKAKLMITFYAADNHYRNGHSKAETSKMDRNPPIANQERDLLTSLKYCTCFLRGPQHDWWQRKTNFAWYPMNCTVCMLLKSAINTWGIVCTHDCILLHILNAHSTLLLYYHMFLSGPYTSACSSPGSSSVLFPSGPTSCFNAAATTTAAAAAAARTTGTSSAAATTTDSNTSATTASGCQHPTTSYHH